MENLLKKFYQLTDREQKLVLISGVVIVVGIFYWAIWSPLNGALEQSRKAVDTKQSDLAWVKRNASKAIQLRKSAGQSAAFTGSLPQAVNQTAGRVKIAISRMQPQGDELKVWVDEAPFNDVLSWLQALEKRGVKILDMDVAKADSPGMIKVRSLQLGKS